MYSLMALVSHALGFGVAFADMGINDHIYSDSQNSRRGLELLSAAILSIDAVLPKLLYGTNETILQVADIVLNIAGLRDLEEASAVTLYPAIYLESRYRNYKNKEADIAELDKKAQLTYLEINEMLKDVDPNSQYAKMLNIFEMK